MDGFGAIVVKVTQKGQENHYEFHYSMMRFHTPQKHQKTFFIMLGIYIYYLYTENHGESTKSAICIIEPTIWGFEIL